jgi:hypothetical protein
MCNEGVFIAILRRLTCDHRSSYEIEPVLIPMLDSYQVTLCETSAGGIFEGQE